MSQWRWGAEHVSLLRHKVYSHVPLLDRVSDLSVPSSGGFYTLDRGGGWETPRTSRSPARQGAGYRGLYDLADPEKSRFMITTGESGHIFSPHYRDLVPLWNAREVDHADRIGGRSEEGGGTGADVFALTRRSAAKPGGAASRRPGEAPSGRRENRLLAMCYRCPAATLPYSATSRAGA